MSGQQNGAASMTALTHTNLAMPGNCVNLMRLLFSDMPGIERVGASGSFTVRPCL